MTTKAPTIRKRSRPRPAFALHIISDATGSLAAHMINAVITQFPSVPFRQIYHVFTRQPEQVVKLTRDLKRRRTIVLYALLDPDNKLFISRICSERGIPHYDLTGSLVQFICDHLSVRPVNELARLHQIDDGYFRRIAAMEFTAQHDEGRRLDTVGAADIILLGLEHVSKSPTATYLSFMGYNVANISIDLNKGIPAQITGRLKRKVLALTVAPRWLFEIRKKQRIPGTTLSGVTREVAAAKKEFLRRGYPVLNTTGMTVEAIAATILKTLGTGQRHLVYE